MGAAFKAAQLIATLVRAAREHAPVAFSSSLSAEDMVITDAILAGELDIGIFTIDTGRLHAETLSLADAIRERYGREVKVYRPDAAALAQYATLHGSDAFYESTELRKRCCHLRKVEPLQRALAGKRGWITGLREVPGAREHIAPAQYDPAYGLVKINPLAQWSHDDVWVYLRERNVPWNRLYENGYRSIGCAPCTRPTLPTEDERAGRWWWEAGTVRECGLHPDSHGHLVRTKELA